MCDEIIETTKTIPINSNDIKVTRKTKQFYILLVLLLVTKALLIIVSIYCYLTTYRAKQKHLLLYHITNN